MGRVSLKVVAAESRNGPNASGRVPQPPNTRAHRDALHSILIPPAQQLTYTSCPNQYEEKRRDQGVKEIVLMHDGFGGKGRQGYPALGQSTGQKTLTGLIERQYAVDSIVGSLAPNKILAQLFFVSARGLLQLRLSASPPTLQFGHDVIVQRLKVLELDLRTVIIEFIAVPPSKVGHQRSK
ncbi:unnamed protein product [Rhizoctonia solani]|uniref:Uncharacterized protein n=1 Tax=Rhizoctonia solani TaxID=456999 RepID=A0A8H3DGN1_9AGAM|nr:unnamed protein product [Rhizoctonia solani]